MVKVGKVIQHAVCPSLYRTEGWKYARPKTKRFLTISHLLHAACISPDYVIVTRDQHPSLLLALQKEYARIFPSTFQDLSKDDYPRIASVHHFDRLKKMIENSQGKVVLQGQMDRESKLMGITVLDEVAWDDAVMQE